MGIPGGWHHNDNVSRRTRALAVWLAAAALALAQSPADLERNFRRPPDSARPKTFWQWMNGNVSREGITLDLEAMKRVGIGGATIFDGGTYLPKGPVDYLSPAWRALMQHAIREGARLGIEIGMHNAPGWSSSGGPWITPDRSMQQLVWTETTVSGPGAREVVLEQPPANLGYYRDAMVLAFPAAPGEEKPYRELVKNTVRTRDFISIEFAGPFEARAVTVFPAFGGRFPNVTLEASDDGATYRRVTTVSNPGRHGIQPPGVRGFTPVSARFFRVTGTGAGELAGVVLHHAAHIEDWNYKANFAYRVGGQLTLPRAEPGDHAIDPKTVIDLSSRMDAAGRLKWDVPAGAWTVLRIGQTATGQKNVSASEAGSGLESDKLSRDATDFHFENVIAKVLADAGPAGGQSLRTVTIDSYEAGLQNWTAAFPEEFRRRAGYDLRGYLPAMTGRIVGSRAISERFLFDVRRAQADMMAEDYYGRMQELSRRHGLKFYVEGYGQGVFDEMQVSGIPDYPMTEFWERTPWTPNRTVKMVSSAAHVYGKSVVAAESFTGEEQTARWLEYPYSLKILGDLMFSLGMNEMVFHRYAHQPNPTAVPGMTMGPWGFHMDRTNTWFDESAAWIAYLARCQYLLRQGTYVADILYFTGERPPGAENFEIPSPPEGFSYDLVNADALFHRASVENGRIRLRDGGAYSVLVLPPDLKGASVEVMRKLREIAAQGARIVGPKPEFSPSLRGYPETDAEVRRIAAGMWDSGRIPAKLEMQTEPDFEYSGRRPDTALSWTHRQLPGADIYFVANRQRRAEDVVATFRVSGRAPEFWNAETGELRQAAVYAPAGDRTRVPLHLEPAGSVFVVFRDAPARTPARWFSRNGENVVGTETAAAAPPPSPRNTFTMEVWARPDTDLRLLPRESAAGRIDETGKFYAIPAGEGDTRFGQGHASAGLAVGRNGAYVIERSSVSAPAVLVAAMPVSGWTHFAVVYREGKPRLYVNGKFVREGLVSGSVVHPGIGSPRPAPDTVYHFNGLDALFRASGRPSPPSNGIAYYFEGNMTEPELVDRALSAEEVAQAASRGIPVPAEPSVPEVWRRAGGRIEALVWRSGTYAAEGGSPVNVTVPPPVTVAGPWSVAFQEGRGAPPSITLPGLVSLRTLSDAGVKYFSGTATYSRTLDVPAAMIGPGKRVYLDLGRVEVVARVRINGTDLGTLWKEPYRIDVTEAVHAGGNALEVRVTDLWTNRLIGDEQLPPEDRYSTGAEHGILQMPEWYSSGRPKPPGGRVTFATWQFYRKDDPLVDSGLLGPVRAVSAVRAVF
ncbi:MAG: alpha-L-arabinofuranosidase [Acidobacteria bacterium]|nr:alpha-L-arabinofuranosidase [Acidobacteriota bacterium]